MGSKRRFSFRWRLFLPMVLLTWIAMAMVMFIQYNREETFREESIDSQLRLISSTIIDDYEAGLDVQPFINSIERYFLNSPLEEVLVSVYDDEGQLLYSIGDPLENTDDNVTPRMDDNGRPLFYAATQRSTDGKLIVHTAMPFTLSIAEALNVVSPAFLSLILFLTAGVTFIAYISCNFLMRNVRLLSTFAKNVDNKDVKIDESQFTHDEIGDISRQMVKLYRDRSSALEKMRREHEVALHAIEEKARIKRQLTNNINHELKTPVGVVRGYLETVINEKDMDEESRNYFLKRALDNVDRLVSLLSDMSAMTRLEEGSGKIPMTELNFHDLVFTIHNDLQQAGNLGKMDFQFNIPLDCVVRGNASLLTSTVNNLVKNAVIHSHGTLMNLELVSESKKYYTFAFSDNGTGVEDVHLPHLFERFYRIDAGRSRKSGGTGLGLPIVKSTIEALGGSITVHNRSKGGLEFVFTLQK